MSRQTDKQIASNLRSILDAARDLIGEVGIPETADDLANGPRINQLAFCECIRRVGEAVAQIDAIADGWLATNLPTVPRREIKATRNPLTHHYWTVDYQILYDIATIHLPALTAAVAAHLHQPDPYR